MNSANLNSVKTSLKAHSQKLSIILLALSFFIANKAVASDFVDCRGLTSITIRAVTLPAIKTNIFYGISSLAKMYVLCTSMANYQTADYWEDLTYGNYLK